MSWQKCPACDGTGQDLSVSISNHIPDCPVCNGSRIIHTVTGQPGPRKAQSNMKIHVPAGYEPDLNNPQVWLKK
jgi:DnaJ-class molecular chaperone